MQSKATYQVVGTASPKFSGGLTTGIQWKGFTLSAHGSFVLGNKVYNRVREQMDADGALTGMNQMSHNNGLGWVRWNAKDESTWEKATHPALVSARADGAQLLSSRFLEDGSFFRLRNVTLSYDLPKSLLEKVKMGGAKIYVSGDNLLTLTRFSGMDPEVSLEMDTYSLPGMYSDNYPIPMSAVLGLDINF